LSGAGGNDVNAESISDHRANLPDPDGPEYDPLGDVVDRSSADSVRRKRPPWWRRRSTWVGLVGAFVALAIAYGAVTLAQVVMTGRSHDADPAQAIVVMGAAQYDGRPSPQLAARLDHVITLWRDGVAPTVVVTGGKQPADRFTEAEASRTYLTERGVDAGSIIMVGEGSTTYESMEVAAPLLVGQGITDVVLVTDPYHSLRSRLISEEMGLDVDVASTPSSVVTGWSSVRRHLEEAGGVAVGRLIGFDRLSDLTG
jgi:uncharacterized SAM-binding protein YcdF (DUF218 family)